MAHKILVSAPVPLELILTGFDWVGAGVWGFGTGLDNFSSRMIVPCILFMIQSNIDIFGKSNHTFIHMDKSFEC